MVSAAPRSPSAPRITIFGLNYWPEETGIAPYTTGLAEHLVREGMDVTVVAGMPYYPQWEIARDYRGRLSRRERSRGVTVVRYRQLVNARQSAFHRAMFEATFLLNSLRSLRLTRPDAVLGVVPSLASGVLARMAARRYRVPYGLLFQDLLGPAGEQSGIAGGGAASRVASMVEGWSARGAARVAVVADAFRPYLEANGVCAERIEHTPNWSHVPRPSRPRAEMRQRLGWTEQQTVALHAGNMGLKQGLDQVVMAARIAAHQQPRLRFVLMGDGNQRPALERLAAGLPNVAFLDAQPADSFPDVLHAADVLLVTQRATVIDMSLPSKLTSYFMAGRPVVAAVDPSSATARFIEEAGGGIVAPADQPPALLGAIMRLADDQPTAARLAAAGQSFAAAHLGAEPSLARMSRFVDSLLSEARIAPGPREVTAAHDS
ncbi:MAG: WcaI family glycosyltransferase [Dehalococcoidia bacterium]|nr:WcaI family glycosyltransferase [Dehalococcoidia bacterium]